MIRWRQYVDDFTKHYDAVKGRLLESDSKECGPFLIATQKPEEAPWHLDWAVLFSNGYYMRVTESYRRLGRPTPGFGERHYFSYHYGEPREDVDQKGFPLTLNAPNAILRVDNDPYGPHIHAGSPEHIYQDRVEGFAILTAEWPEFLEAVIEHRAKNRPLVDLLNITIRTPNA